MYERIIYRKSFLFLSNCYDGPDDENPTCGWAYTSSGKKIPNSQVKKIF